MNIKEKSNNKNFLTGIKNKSKHILAGAPKLTRQASASSEFTVVDTLDKIKNEIQNENESAFIEKDEAIFIEKIEKQNGFLDPSQNTHKKFSKIYFINIIKDKKRLFITFIPWILLFILLIALFLLWSQLADIKKDPLKAAQAETNEVIRVVGEIMILPTGETPKVATLTDADINKVKTQSFFINAKVGDKLLVYSLARKVILYNPQTNKIVEVANLDSTIGNQPIE